MYNVSGQSFDRVDSCLRQESLYECARIEWSPGQSTKHQPASDFLIATNLLATSIIKIKLHAYFDVKNALFHMDKAQKLDCLTLNIFLILLLQQTNF
jgi:hypothetical protein